MRDAIVEKTAVYVRSALADAEKGHDWFHIERVWKLAQLIGRSEEAHGVVLNMQVIETGALLHDIADAKFHGGDEEIGPRTARAFLTSIGAQEDCVLHVENIVRHISFKGADEKQKWMSPELAVVQDADRLDGLGAIGIARTFHYGGHKDRLMHDPHIPPREHLNAESYYSGTGQTTINHFYEKLLLLKDRMNTETGKRLAERRHVFLRQFLNEFHREWNVEE